MRQEEEVERKLHNNLPVLESTDEELEYADAEESEYHTPLVVKSPSLQLIHPELSAFGTMSLPCEECPPLGIGWCEEGTSLVASPGENEIPLPVCVSYSKLVNPNQGQRAIRSIGPIHLSFIFDTPTSLREALAQDGSLPLPNLSSVSPGDNGLTFQEIAMQVFSRAMLLQRALQLLTEVNEGTLGAVTPMMMRALGLGESEEGDKVEEA